MGSQFRRSQHGSKIKKAVDIQKLNQSLSTMTIVCTTTETLPAMNDKSDGFKVESRASFEVRKKEAQVRRRRKKKTDRTLVATTFSDLYTLTGEILGEGSYGRVCTCINIYTQIEYAVKIIEKTPGLYNRSKVLKEIEIYHLCRGQQNIIQLVEYFEEDDRFCLVFEKISGGPLLDHIQARVCFTESEASRVVSDLAEAIRFLHSRGIAHRDIKPDNILCVNSDSPVPVKLCDEYDSDDDEDLIIYNKKCDMWSLGIIMYILLCGYAPFSGNCGYNCGWDRGDNCTDCQEMLFQNILEGQLMFPEEHWSDISPLAKTLICQLLTKDSSHRMTAEQLLAHPWITTGGCNIHTPLTTPSNLRRQTSIKELEDFASRAMAVNRAVQKSETWGAQKQPSTSSFSSNSYNTNRVNRVYLWDSRKTKCFSINELTTLELDSLSMK